MIREFWECGSFHEAVDDIEIEQAVIVEIAELARPAPTCCIDSGSYSGIFEHTYCLQNVGLDLRIVGGTWFFCQSIQNRNQGLVALLIAGIGFHVRRENFEVTI